MTVLATAAAALAPGQWAQLPTPQNFSPSVFRAGTSTTVAYQCKVCWDPINRQIRWIGKAHGADQRFHQYDEATHAFSVLPDPYWDDGGTGKPTFGGHAYDHNAIDPATGDLYYRVSTQTPRIYRLDRATETWTEFSTMPSPYPSRIAGAMEWLPNIGTQGGLIVARDKNAKRWDKASGAWVNLTVTSGAALGQGNHMVAVCLQPHGVVALGGGNINGQRLWTVGPTGGLIQRADCPTNYGCAYQAVTVSCPVSGDFLVIKPGGVGHAFDFDPNGPGSWAALAGVPNFPNVEDVVAAPISTHGVVMVIDVPRSAVWLYRHA